MGSGQQQFFDPSFEAVGMGAPEVFDRGDDYVRVGVGKSAS